MVAGLWVAVPYASKVLVVEAQVARCVWGGGVHASSATRLLGCHAPACQPTVLRDSGPAAMCCS
ncbi:hypothetical protein HaLaN_13196 [Haematococcus lacustris]|uniref:Uncharacterized protein n=1 Tax=Haematococcus lacustris TaxID=44745 RepID=A0A699ZCI7_HAELA|nr:hypothetical protein HaLaN_13196 [Haematococcus lacustris]